MTFDPHRLCEELTRRAQRWAENADLHINNLAVRAALLEIVAAINAVQVAQYETDKSEGPL